jgi:hypothetical protein
MDYSYQAEKFSNARRSLMLPHAQGEDLSIAHAFHECSLGLHDLDLASLDDDPRAWIIALEGLMDTTGLADPRVIGTWAVKAGSLTTDQMIELSRIVDELAHWFDRQR